MMLLHVQPFTVDIIKLCIPQQVVYVRLFVSSEWRYIVVNRLCRLSEESVRSGKSWADYIVRIADLCVC